MARRMFVLCFALLLVTATPARAQNQLYFKPLDPATDPDIDLFMGDWRDSLPFNTHGSITERAILTRCTGDELKPSRKGAVLTVADRLSRATLHKQLQCPLENSIFSR